MRLSSILLLFSIAESFFVAFGNEQHRGTSSVVWAVLVVGAAIIYVLEEILRVLERIERAKGNGDEIA